MLKSKTHEKLISLCNKIIKRSDAEISIWCALILLYKEENSDLIENIIYKTFDISEDLEIFNRLLEIAKENKSTHQIKKILLKGIIHHKVEISANSALALYQLKIYSDDVKNTLLKSLKTSYHNHVYDSLIKLYFLETNSEFLMGILISCLNHNYYKRIQHLISENNLTKDRKLFIVNLLKSRMKTISSKQDASCVLLLHTLQDVSDQTIQGLIDGLNTSYYKYIKKILIELCDSKALKEKLISRLKHEIMLGFSTGSLHAAILLVKFYEKTDNIISILIQGFDKIPEDQIIKALKKLVCYFDVKKEIIKALSDKIEFTSLKTRILITNLLAELGYYSEKNIMSLIRELDNTSFQHQVFTLLLQINERFNLKNQIIKFTCKELDNFNKEGRGSAAILLLNLGYYPTTILEILINNFDTHLCQQSIYIFLKLINISSDLKKSVIENLIKSLSHTTPSIYIHAAFLLTTFDIDYNILAEPLIKGITTDFFWLIHKTVILLSKNKKFKYKIIDMLEKDVNELYNDTVIFRKNLILLSLDYNRSKILVNLVSNLLRKFRPNLNNIYKEKIEDLEESLKTQSVPLVFEKLKYLLMNDSFQIFHVEILLILISLPNKSLVDGLDSQVYSTLEFAVKSNNNEVCLNAILSSNNFVNHSPYRYLNILFKGINHQEEKIRLTASKMLYYLLDYNQELISLLVEALNDNNLTIKEYVLLWLCNFQNKQLIFDCLNKCSNKSSFLVGPKFEFIKIFMASFLNNSDNILDLTKPGIAKELIYIYIDTLKDVINSHPNKIFSLKIRYPLLVNNIRMSNEKSLTKTDRELKAVAESFSDNILGHQPTFKFSPIFAPSQQDNSRNINYIKKVVSSNKYELSANSSSDNLTNTHWYSDADISCYLKNMLHQAWGDFCGNGSMLLNGPNDAQFRIDDKLTHVAVFDAVDTVGRSTPIDYFIDKSQQVVPVKQDDRHDVFDELEPLFRQNSNCNVIILFPYNQTQSHWLTGEINISKETNTYTINIYAHDPYAKQKTMEVNNFNILSAAIIRRIKSFDSNAAIIIENKPSPYGQRQADADGSSCGVIVCEDILLRIRDRNLVVNNKPYPAGTRELREKHSQVIQNHMNMNEAFPPKPSLY